MAWFEWLKIGVIAMVLTSIIAAGTLPKILCRLEKTHAKSGVER